MSKPTKEPLRMTSEAYRKDRAKVLEEASSGRVVVITDEQQKPTTLLVTPRDKLPAYFE